MERFVRGDVVVLPFPFSHLTESKRRPALVLAELDGDDRILCQSAIQGFIFRFTADRKIIIYKAGHLKSDKIDAALQKIIEIYLANYSIASCIQIGVHHSS